MPNLKRSIKEEDNIRMAAAIKMTHPQTGLTKTGYFGFSWTTLFFGPLPSLFRGDFITFIGQFIIIPVVYTAGLFFAIFPILGIGSLLNPIGSLFNVGGSIMDASGNIIYPGNSALSVGVILLVLVCYFWSIPIIWAFIYNRYYTKKLIEKGYIFSDSAELEKRARRALGIVSPQPQPQASP